MQYTTAQLAALSGVTTRTLRYYHQIGLLRPDKTIGGGVRVYGPAAVDRLQHILFYRELGLELSQIQEILDNPDFDSLAALRSHRTALLEQRDRLSALLKTVDKTIRARERGIPMPDDKKFEAFKQKLVDENERLYGAEVRKQYGEETVAASNKQLLNMSQEAYSQMEQTGKAILDALDEAFETGDPHSEAAQRAASLHKQWLAFTWPSYSAEAHAALAERYVEDARFSAHYDRGTPGKAALLRDAILAYLR